MNPTLMAGISIVNLALVSYTVAIIIQRRKKLVTKKVLTFLTLGIILDITSTICMIIGAGHFITVHGIIGYSSLAGMVADTIYSYSLVRKKGLNVAVSPAFNRWSGIAWLYWIAAYITGVVIVVMK
jgi:energy-converting hydrogenase Eha subunit G